MIKFLRHIRKQLLAESKYSKYLRYAIGEIILEVIGILTALQINVWVDIDEKKLASGFISLTAIKGYSHYTFINEIENIKEQTTIVLRQINSQNQ